MEEFINFEDLLNCFNAKNEDNFIQNEEEINWPHPLMLSDKFVGEFIVNKKITDEDIKFIKVGYTKFYNCKLENCDMSGCFFWMCVFQKCEFINCNFEGLVFRKSAIDNSIIRRCKSRFSFNTSESYIYDTSYFDCLFEGIEISGTATFDVIFEKCFIDMGRYQGNVTFRQYLSYFEKTLSEDSKKLVSSKKNFEDLTFNKCHIYSVNFRDINFKDTRFNNCEISSSSFNNCKFYAYNFDESNNKKTWGRNLVDFSTLKESHQLTTAILKRMFNIDSQFQHKIQEMLQGQVTTSVFISYSLQDSEIAENINSYLKDAGIPTFLWEKDALGGETLVDIMRSNINAKDRLLFIASENSLKSKACHFELSEGRKKQEKLWKTILFPVHIDDFLFKVQFEQIRPVDKREEFWENIKELRSINSLDFSEFKNGCKRKKAKFKMAMEKLILSLKVE